MKKLTYVFSGFSPNEHFGEEVSKVFEKDLKECENIVFIPGGMGKNIKTDKYVNTDVEWFREIGVNIKNINILDTGMNNEIVKEIINKADILFLMGGNTIKQYEFICQLKIQKEIKDFNGVVIGVSAGAINLGKVSLCSKDLEDGVEKTQTYNGIGRVNYTFEPHFDKSNIDLLENELYPVSTDLNIYGLTNNTGVKINEKEKYEIIRGDLYVISHNKLKIIRKK